MPEFDTCGNCGKEISADSDFCPHCGVLFEHTTGVACETHPDREATRTCVICYQLMCEECRAPSSDRYLCMEHREAELLDDWAKVFQSPNEAEAELVKGLLESFNFRSVILRNRIQEAQVVKVFVPLPDYSTAVEFLQSREVENNQEEGFSET